MNISRRSFARMGAIAAAGITVHSSLRADWNPLGANDRIHVGLIGCKNMGWSNLFDFLQSTDVSCMALCDVDEHWLNTRAKDVEKMRGTKPALYKDYRKMLELKELDAVIIGTPDHWHCLMAVDACYAGKDVYVEKPLANSIAECRAMVFAARKNQRVIQVGQQQRSGSEWRDAISIVKSGKLGKINRIKCWANFNYAAVKPVPDTSIPPGIDFDLWLGPAPERTFNQARFHGSWRMFWDYGGGLMTDWGVHLLDMALWAMDVRELPEIVTASGGKFAYPGYANETPDTLNVSYQFNDWVLDWENNAGIQSGPWGRNYGVAFIGSNGTLVADRDNWEVFPEWGENSHRMEPIPKRLTDNQSHVNHVYDFLNCMKSRETPACSVETGSLVASLAHMGNIAFRTGTRLILNRTDNDFGSNKEANQLITPVYRSPWKLPS